MPITTAQPPVQSTYVPPDVARVFRALLDSIHVLDEKHGTNTPSRTLLLIMAAARQLGVPPGALAKDESS